MKYIIENNNLICREYGEVISDIIEKMYAIEDSLEFIIEEYQRQFPNEITSEIISVRHADQITVDLCNTNDEFYIENGKNYLYIEVVTEDIAQANDKDFLSDVSAEKLKGENYQVGDGKYSYYTKLEDTKYYFRFM